jgi:ATP-dependent DNA helicase PIF1
VIHREIDSHYAGTTILPKNEAVDRFNQLRLDEVGTSLVSIPSTRWGRQRPEWKQIPSALPLKVGALVMILANYRDGEEYVYVNGDLGEVVDVLGEQRAALVKLRRTDRIVRVNPITREFLIPLDPGRRKALKEAGELGKIKERYEIVGAIDYLPIRLAYATTVHKSQGLTLDEVQISLRDPFISAPGMCFVAMSRARTAAGLRLIGTPEGLLRAIKTEPKVRGWL